MDLPLSEPTSAPTAKTAATNRPALNWVQQLTEFVTEIWGAWCSFWFTPADPLTLGIIRILTGWMLVYNLLVWGSDLQAFFGIHSLQPVHAIVDLHRNDPVFSFWYYVPESWIQTVHWSCVGIALMFFLGIGTRVTSIAAYLITISYSQRVPVANFGLDQILGLLCLYLAIGPSGACLSVDAWLKGRRTGRTSGDKAPRSASAQVALRLIQLHLCVIYFWAGFAKLKGDSWWTGEAMWQVMANMEYQTLDLTWMANIPWLPYLLAHVTVAWEVFFCVLIWNRRLRPLMLLIGTGMHFGIGAFLGMWTFGLIMTYAYFAFADQVAWRKRITKLFPGSAISSSKPSDDSDGSDFCLHPTTPPSPPSPPAKTLPPMTDVAARMSMASRPAPKQNDNSAKSELSIPQSASVHAALPTSAPWDSQRVAMTGDIDRDPVADRILCNQDAALLLLSIQSEERTTLRNYFRRHDIPCRAVTTVETALSLVIPLAPAAIVISGSRLTHKQVAELVDDLRDLSEAPIVVALSMSQYDALADRDLAAEIIIYPASPRQIRETVSRMMFGETSPSIPDTDPPRISSDVSDREVTLP